MNYYKKSNGTRISKSTINRFIHDAKRQLIINQYQEYGYNFCKECQSNPAPQSAGLEIKMFDCSHIESVDSCQKNGYAEKAYDIKNMRILCRYHHRLHDKTNLNFKEIKE